MACEKLYFSNVTDEVWQKIVAGVRAYGVTLTEHAGEASSMGFKVAWDYDAEAEIGWLHCISKPFMIPCVMVDAQMRQQLTSCGAELCEAPEQVT